MSEPFIGEIRIFSGHSCPRGWLTCDGSWVSISAYSDLYQVIGVTFGGDAKGRYVFGLPDLSGRAAIGIGRSSAVASREAAYVLGERGGVDSVPLSPSDIPAHSHTMRRKSPTSSAAKGHLPAASSDIGVLARVSDNIAVMMMAPGYAARSKLDSRTIGSTWGYAAPHENRQPFLALHYAIAYDGVFPLSSSEPAPDPADPSGVAEA